MTKEIYTKLINDKMMITFKIHQAPSTLEIDCSMRTSAKYEIKLGASAMDTKNNKIKICFVCFLF